MPGGSVLLGGALERLAQVSAAQRLARGRRRRSAGSSAASLRTDSLACSWSQAQAGWGTLASPSGSGFSRAESTR